MRLRVVAACAALMAVHSAANAWFFFMVPTGLIQNAIEGSNCVAASAKVGDVVAFNGRQWKIKSLGGTSSRCNQNPQWTVIAKLEPLPTQEELSTPQPMCLPQGMSVGSRTTAPIIGEVEVVSIGGDQCANDPKAPVSARVMAIKVGDPAPSRQPPVQNAAAPQKPVADRLRELKDLHDQGLITNDVYESKQKDILSSP